MKRGFCIILCAVLLFLLHGCHAQSDPGAVGSAIWTEMPALTYGAMEYEKLQILPWNSGRTEATSYNMMAETEKGWYLLHATWLWYADKENPGNWVIVCSEPDCDHFSPGCGGRLMTSTFIVKDQRIHYIAALEDLPQYDGKEGGPVITSMSMNGKDPRLEYREEGVLIFGAGEIANYLLPDQWIAAASALDPQGNTVVSAFRVTEDGSQQFYRDENGPENISILAAKNVYSLYGDKYLCCSFLDETGNKIFRFEGDTLIERNVDGLPLKGGYLSGNILRCFRPNDGYYDIDLDSGQEIRLSDAQFANSYCVILLPNCILESTLLYPVSTQGRTEKMHHTVSVYDGTQWRSVLLPPELEQAGKDFYITVQAVTSNGILLACRDSKTSYKTTGTVYYHITLTDEPLVAEYWTEILLPYVEKE